MSTSQVQPERVKFVIQFSGPDLPGLLHTFTKPLQDKQFNIDDISLATGGPRHTTFLTCSKKADPSRAGTLDRWRERRELEQALNDEVTKKYKEWSKTRSEAFVAPEPVRIDLLDDEQSQTVFSVYMSIALKNSSGATHAVANLFQYAFTIKDASDSPLFPPGEGEHGAPRLEDTQWMKNYRVLWLTLEHRGVQSSPAANGSSELTALAGVLAGLIRKRQRKPTVGSAKRLIAAIQQALETELRDHHAFMWAAHVVDSDGTAFYSPARRGHVKLLKHIRSLPPEPQ